MPLYSLPIKLGPYIGMVKDLLGATVASVLAQGILCRRNSVHHLPRRPLDGSVILARGSKRSRPLGESKAGKWKQLVQFSIGVLSFSSEGKPTVSNIFKLKDQ